MNEQFQNNEPLDRRDARRQRREERLEALGGAGANTWIMGVILIVLGGIFLLQNLGTFYFLLQNWWALFILIPALGSFDRAYRAYKHAGNRFTAFVRNSMFIGLILTTVTGMFLFNLPWTYLGPIMIILVGAGILANSMLSAKE